MLFLKNRLRKKKDFENVLKNKQSRSFAFSFLAVRFVKNETSKTRIGLVVSKKVSKKAVIRNKIKRQLREITRPLAKKSKQGIDLVIFVRPEIIGKNFSEIKEVANFLLNRAGIR